MQLCLKLYLNANLEVSIFFSEKVNEKQRSSILLSDVLNIYLTYFL